MKGRDGRNGEKTGKMTGKRECVQKEGERERERERVGGGGGEREGEGEEEGQLNMKCRVYGKE